MVTDTSVLLVALGDVSPVMLAVTLLLKALPTLCSAESAGWLYSSNALLGPRIARRHNVAPKPVRQPDIDTDDTIDRRPGRIRCAADGEVCVTTRPLKSAAGTRLAERPASARRTAPLPPSTKTTPPRSGRMPQFACQRSEIGLQITARRRRDDEVAARSRFCAHGRHRRWRCFQRTPTRPARPCLSRHRKYDHPGADRLAWRSISVNVAGASRHALMRATVPSASASPPSWHVHLSPGQAACPRTPAPPPPAGGVKNASTPRRLASRRCPPTAIGRDQPTSAFHHDHRVVHMRPNARCGPCKPPSHAHRRAMRRCRPK